MPVRVRFAVLVLLLATAPAGGQQHVRLMLQWMPQAQFAGYYMAEHQGFYADAGLDVQLLRGGPDRNGLQWLREGKTDFLLMWLTSALQAAGNGEPLVCISQLIQQPNVAVVGWKHRGIEQLTDLNGKRTSVWLPPFRTAFLAFFQQNGVSPVLVPQHYTINLFLREGVDACAVMDYNEYNMIYQAGVDHDRLTVFHLKDYDAGFPEDGIYCKPETCTAHPDVCRALSAASLAGWRYAAAHPQETLDVIMQHVHEARLPTNRAHMRWMLQSILPSILPGEGDAWTPGRLDPDDYERAAQWMLELGFIDHAPAYGAFAAEELDVP